MNPRAAIGLALSVILAVLGCARMLPDRFKLSFTPGPPMVTGAGTEDTFTGYEYEIEGIAATNSPVLATNRIPVRRVHVDLSLDGGSNYSRRIAYGIPVNADRLSFDYTYSLDWTDRTLLTERARLRFTDMEGNFFGQSAVYTIAGIYGIFPAAGDTLVGGSNYEIEWFQSGGRPETEISYITPDNVIPTPLATMSNAVFGHNAMLMQLAIPALPEVKLVFRSVSDPNIIGYSGIFEVQ